MPRDESRGIVSPSVRTSELLRSNFLLHPASGSNHVDHKGDREANREGQVTEVAIVLRCVTREPWVIGEEVDRRRRCDNEGNGANVVLMVSEKVVLN